MIYDKVDNIETYLGIDSNLDMAIREIQSGNYSNWKSGRHDLQGEDVFCNIVHLKTNREALWERHERYLDIHVVTEGSEIIRCSDYRLVPGWGSYDYEGDSALAPYSEEGIDVFLEPGWFLIVFPQDAHMPGLYNKTDFSDKVIFKVRVK